MFIKIIIFAILPLFIDLILLLKPVKHSKLFKSKRLKFKVTRNGITERVKLYLSEFNTPYRISSRTSDYVYMAQNGAIRVNHNNKTFPLSKLSFTSDSDERVQLCGPRFVFTKLAIIILICLEFIFIPRFEDKLINTFETCYTKLDPSTVMSHEFIDPDAEANDAVYNLLIVGTDQRNDESPRADVMMLLSINHESKTIKLISIQRDLAVHTFTGEQWVTCKIGESFSYGTGSNAEEKLSSSADVLCNAIEYNYGCLISDVIIVDFKAVSAIIDAVGGVEMNLDNNVAEAINKVLDAEQNQLFNRSDSVVVGNQILNGNEALAYLRVRNIGDGSDIGRNTRQREFIKELFFQKFKYALDLEKIDTKKLAEAANSVYSTLDRSDIQIILNSITSMYTIDFGHSLPMPNMWNTYIENGKEYVYVPYNCSMDIKEQTNYLCGTAD